MRKVVESAVPRLLKHAPRPATRVVVVTGEPPAPEWWRDFQQSLAGVPAEIRVERAVGYLAGQTAKPRAIAARIGRVIGKTLDSADDPVVWCHNPGVGRNLLLGRAVAAACAGRRVPLVMHHHDWWFDNRWRRWPEMRAAGIRSMAAAAGCVFAAVGKVVHLAINRSDAHTLARHLGGRAVWLPNPVERVPMAPARVHAARRWLMRRHGIDGRTPIWLLPGRVMRRKNVLEACLLARWLRPEAWLLVTGGASSAEEEDTAAGSSGRPEGTAGGCGRACWPAVVTRDGPAWMNC